MSYLPLRDRMIVPPTLSQTVKFTPMAGNKWCAVLRRLLNFILLSYYDIKLT